ncbi:MAG: nucleotide sugar dehydrogenase [Kordiimonadaceae bacterium]|nr:nucleotide sugar dehydrogenase [Kordiimonadaceae bacterium]MBO6569318.1 nucleotide sugar dehydrogenase [Kordiimonadaceae bacterium]MBO6964794.1 nucleotide sugar dehydrogenase [Kordiimonadaceae bacterium]
MSKLQQDTIAIIGLGYVGLPLAVSLSKKYQVIGYDIDPLRISELRAGFDRTGEVDSSEALSAGIMLFTDQASEIEAANIYIVTVPTPIDKHKKPDLRPLISASELVGGALSQGDIVIYESTVFPGATEEVCVPILEACSGLAFNTGFGVGYSPERINPADKLHTIDTIVKVTSGSSPQVSERVAKLYESIVSAGIYPAGSIKVAEAAKVIENTQRDLNIALVNELAIIFGKLGIDTKEVLDAASTKWNFLRFSPGLVGGHCIGVDPYYLTHKAEEIGYSPQIILSGRRINDQMSAHIASEVMKLMNLRKKLVNGSRGLVLGLTFKENCPDLRNSKVFEMIDELQACGAQIDVFDPMISHFDVPNKNFHVTNCPDNAAYSFIVVAVPHEQFKELGVQKIRRWGEENCVVYDVKSAFEQGSCDGRL